MNEEETVVELTEEEMRTTENFDLVPPFEPLYECIKTDKNRIWFYYEEKDTQVSRLAWIYEVF